MKIEIKNLYVINMEKHIKINIKLVKKTNRY